MKQASCMMLLVFLALAVSACHQSDQKGQADKSNQQTAQSSKKADWPIVWKHPGGGCQNTRTQVLVKRRVNLIQWADPGCTLSGGTWQSWGHDIQVGLNQAMVVPLVTPHNAVKSGAKDWTRKQQIAFINDKENLIILDPMSVQQRKNYGPQRWIPIPQFRCVYGKRWKKVKQRYHLSMLKDEKKAVAALVAMCPSDKIKDASSD